MILLVYFFRRINVGIKVFLKGAGFLSALEEDRGYALQNLFVS